MSDILTTIKYGIIMAGICTVLLLLGGFLFRGFSLFMAISTWRSGMCILSGLFLFFVAGTILLKKNKQIEPNSHWRKKFIKLNYGSVVAIIAILFVLVASVADTILISLSK